MHMHGIPDAVLPRMPNTKSKYFLSSAKTNG